ncbi:hypothetical protein ABPG77_010524 [Micractinium sp. CCAP 211/92]
MAEAAPAGGADSGRQQHRELESGVPGPPASPWLLTGHKSGMEERSGIPMSQVAPAVQAHGLTNVQPAAACGSSGATCVLTFYLPRKLQCVQTDLDQQSSSSLCVGLALIIGPEDDGIEDLEVGSRDGVGAAAPAQL